MLGGGNDNNIKNLLKQVIRSNKRLDKGVSQVSIEDAWREQMGDVICSYTERMYFREGVLTVYLNSAPLRSELSMSKDRLIQLLNEACKEDIVKKVILK